MRGYVPIRSNEHRDYGEECLLLNVFLFNKYVDTRKNYSSLISIVSFKNQIWNLSQVVRGVYRNVKIFSLVIQFFQDFNFYLGNLTAP